MGRPASKKLLADLRASRRHEPKPVKPSLYTELDEAVLHVILTTGDVLSWSLDRDQSILAQLAKLPPGMADSRRVRASIQRLRKAGHIVCRGALWRRATRRG